MKFSPPKYIVIQIILILFLNFVSFPLTLAENASIEKSEILQEINKENLDITFTYQDKESIPDISSIQNMEFTLSSSTNPINSIMNNHNRIKSTTIDSLKNAVISGSFSTQLSTGSAAYSYPLILPPAVNSFEPTIYLNYNHQQTTNSKELGNAWSINKNLIYRNINNTLSNYSDDYFTLHFNGMNLELLYSEIDGLYHTKQENYFKIEKKQDGNNFHKDYWLLTTKDGIKYRFGYTTNSELISNQENFVSIWSLDLIEDTHQNKINFIYNENLNSDYYNYLKEINYNNGLNKVEFIYESKNSEFIGYMYGTKIIQTQKIKDLRISYDNLLVRKYSLNYFEIDGNEFIKEIYMYAKDEKSFLPPVKFTYFQPNKTWQTQKFNLPEDIFFGNKEDKGIRILDFNYDGYDDILLMYNTSDLTYWINNKEDGWDQKQKLKNFFSSSFTNSKGQDVNLRFVDLNSDTKIEILQAIKEDNLIKTTIRKLDLESSEENYTLPENIVIIEKKDAKNKCIPNYCPAYYTDIGVSCNNRVCNRNCYLDSCGGNERIVFTKTKEDPKWDDDNRYEEEDKSPFFEPTQKKCYRFEYTGPIEETDNDKTQCYDFETDNIYRKDDYDKDCDGKSLSVYAGVGFFGEKEENSWLKTLPGQGGTKPSYGFVPDYKNNKWDNRYFSKIEYDPSDGDGEWEKFNDLLCYDTHIIYCAPSWQACQVLGKSRCGYGCLNEGISVFAVMGIYRDESKDLLNALYDFEPLCEDDIVKDNEYEGNGDFIVKSYDIVRQTKTNTCNYTPYDYLDQGVRFVDINSDGQTDIIKLTPTEQKVWFNTNETFKLISSWNFPSNLSFIDSENQDTGLRIQDINSDGFPDLILSKGITKKTYLNNQNSFVEVDFFKIPLGAEFLDSNGNSQGVIFMDINTDDKIDLVKLNENEKKVWINKGTKWEETFDWIFPEKIDLLSQSIKQIDINADTSIDFIYSNTPEDEELYLNRYTKANLLTQIDNGYGGLINLNYEKLSSYDNTGDDNENDIPFGGWVISSINYYNGLEDEHKLNTTLNYNYFSGYYDIDEKEYMGFSKVIETKFDNSFVEHYFYQDKDKKGLEYETILYNPQKNIYTKTKNNFVVELNKSLGFEQKKIFLESTINSFYDGEQLNPLISQTFFEYDKYGNLIKTIYSGDTSILGDEKTLYTEYIYNHDKWILTKPKLTYLKDAQNKNYSKIQYSYDNLDYGKPPKKGDLTKKEIICLNCTKNHIETYNYDSAGNLISKTDALKNTLKYTYDNTNVFIIKVTNPLGHEIYYNYDLSTGNLNSEKDYNNYELKYYYDIHARPIKEVNQDDSFNLPTKEIEYHLNENSSYIKLKLRPVSKENKTYDSYEYYDKLLNLIQTKTIVNEGYIIQDFFLDNSGNLKKETLPLFYNKNSTHNFSNYESPKENANYYTFDYNALGRLTKLKNPDATIKEIIYEKKNITLIDENKNKIKYEKDIYGNIINIFEYNQGEIYTTNYVYDVLGNLIQITDNQGNKVKYTFDDLGRKIKLEDPNIGNWTYQYNLLGNLILQKDNKNNQIFFTYDPLGRIKTKEINDYLVEYNYDDKAYGFLDKIKTPNYIIYYDYNQNLLLDEEKIKIDNQTFIRKYTYDNFGRIISEEINNKEQINYTYNEQGLSSILGFITNLKYNEFNKIKRKDYVNGLSSVYNYDKESFRLEYLKTFKLSDTKNYNFTTAKLQDYEYSYDNLGNILLIQSQFQNISKEEYFEYDDLSRLIQAKEKETYGKIDYTYDSIGNLLFLNSTRSNLTFIYNQKKSTYAPQSYSDSGYIEKKDLINKGIIIPPQNSIFDTSLIYYEELIKKENNKRKNSIKEEINFNEKNESNIKTYNNVITGNALSLNKKEIKINIFTNFFNVLKSFFRFLFLKK